jgi:hypothetical protein
MNPYVIQDSFRSEGSKRTACPFRGGKETLTMTQEAEQWKRYWSTAILRPWQESCRRLMREPGVHWIYTTGRLVGKTWFATWAYENLAAIPFTIRAKRDLNVLELFPRASGFVLEARIDVVDKLSQVTRADSGVSSNSRSTSRSNSRS